jgi:aminomethyltransferase
MEEETLLLYEARMTSTNSLKHTPLYDFHRTHGKMVEFAGYEMPIWYTTTSEEHMAVRNNAGIFDVSHMGRVDVTGPDAAAFVEKLLPTGIGKQPNGKSVYTLLLNEAAGIIDDLIVLKMEEGRYLLVVNAATKEKDLMHMQKVGGDLDFRIDDISAQTTMIAVQGPSAVEALQPLTPLSLAGVKRFTHTFSTVKGIKTIITRTGYTGEDGFEIIVYDAAADAMGIWESLAKVSTPCALGARDSLRLEAGLPLYGTDMDESTNPLEADLGWVISKDKQSYVGWESLAKLSQRGPSRIRRGVLMEERIPRHGFSISNIEGEEIGDVTSGTFSPLLKRGIAMGYIKTTSSQFGQDVRVIVRDTPSPGRITKFPFYDDSQYGWKRGARQ